MRQVDVRDDHATMVEDWAGNLAAMYDRERYGITRLAASWHDIGKASGPGDHGEVGARLFLEDPVFQSWRKQFTAEELQIIADAIRLHSASNFGKHTTTVGKFVYDGDRVGYTGQSRLKRLYEARLKDGVGPIKALREAASDFLLLFSVGLFGSELGSKVRTYYGQTWIRVQELYEPICRLIHEKNWTELYKLATSK